MLAGWERESELACLTRRAVTSGQLREVFVARDMVIGKKSGKDGWLMIEYI
jgi:hypothetical protein